MLAIAQHTSEPFDDNDDDYGNSCHAMAKGSKSSLGLKSLIGIILVHEASPRKPLLCLACIDGVHTLRFKLTALSMELHDFNIISTLNSKAWHYMLIGTWKGFNFKVLVHNLVRK